MRVALAVVTVLLLTPFARAQDDNASVKQAYLNYMQARLDRNPDAARAASTGDEAHQHFLTVDMERQLLIDKIQKAMMKFPRIGRVSPPTSRPTVSAKTAFKSMLDAATITTDGDTARLTPKGAPFSYGFRKVNGAWMADLDHWGPPIPPEMTRKLEDAVPFIREIVTKIDSGEIKNAQQLQDAMRHVELAAGFITTKPAATTSPSTTPAR